MTERQGARMSKINNGGLDQYGGERFEQQQFGTAGVEGVKALYFAILYTLPRLSTRAPECQKLKMMGTVC